MIKKIKIRATGPGEKGRTRKKTRTRKSSPTQKMKMLKKRWRKHRETKEGRKKFIKRK